MLCTLQLRTPPRRKFALKFIKLSALPTVERLSLTSLVEYDSDLPIAVSDRFAASNGWDAAHLNRGTKQLAETKL